MPNGVPTQTPRPVLSPNRQAHNPHGPRQAKVSFPAHRPGEGPRDQKAQVPAKPRVMPKPQPAQELVASPDGEIQYSPEETANLLEYCDELLADLERVANY